MNGISCDKKYTPRNFNKYLISFIFILLLISNFSIQTINFKDNQNGDSIFYDNPANDDISNGNNDNNNINNDYYDNTEYYANNTVNHETNGDDSIHALNTMNLQDSSSNSDNIMFQGLVKPLVVNETAYSYYDESYTIGNGTNQDIQDENASYFIDETHNWKTFRYNATISNLEDKRDWVRNGNFGGDEPLSPILRVYQDTSYYPYSNNENPNLNSPDAIITTNSDYIRVHFTNITTEQTYDFVNVYDQNDNLIDKYDGIYLDWVTPWYNASTLKFCMDTDNAVVKWGFSSDYYEIYNGTFLPLSNNSWNYYNYTTNDNSRLYGGTSEINNHSAVSATINGILVDKTQYKYSYAAGDQSAWYQNISIPRGKVKDAWISFDYYLKKGIQSNDFFVFYKINGIPIYSKGFRTIRELGKFKWHSTGLINIKLWDNSTNVFPDILYNNQLNISVGIQTDSTVTYSGFEDVSIQEAYFDNIQLILLTEANSTQPTINLTLDGNSASDGGDSWGYATYLQSGSWYSNPMLISLNCNAPQINFNLQSQLDQYHTTNTTSTDSTNDYGVQLTIDDMADPLDFNDEYKYTSNLTSIKWSFYHLVYIPLGYLNYTFKIEKPLGWNITMVKDPTGLDTAFYGGRPNDTYIKINSSQAGVPGWWYFEAESANLLCSNSTYIWNKGSWNNFEYSNSSNIKFDVNDQISIKTKLEDISNEGTPIPNVDSTLVNISYYHPNKTLFYSESVHPGISGEISFTNLTFGNTNTTGGEYTYRITWSNQTSAGGLNGTFLVYHSINYQINYPKDAKTDLSARFYLGDVIPISIYLNDSNNGGIIRDAEINYNWTSGGSNLLIPLTEITNGIYEGSADSNDLENPGIYYIQFNISKFGFYNKQFIIVLDIIEETAINVVDYDNYIELGQNFSVTIQYSSAITSLGLQGANLGVNYSNSFYTVFETANPGIYLFNFSTECLNSIGLYRLVFEAKKTNYEDQKLDLLIELRPRTIDLKIFIDETEYTNNPSYTTHIMDDITFEFRALTADTKEYVQDGLVTIEYTKTGSNTFTNDSNSDNSELVTLTAEQVKEQNGSSIKYRSIIKTQDLGVGIHFISISFSKENYNTKSLVFKLEVLKIKPAITLNSTNKVFIKQPNTDFEAVIYLENPETNIPITTANGTYSWIFGTGNLTNLGGGYYKINADLPKFEGTFEILIALSVDESYEISYINIQVITRRETTSVGDIWWLWVLIAAVLSVLGAIIFKQNVINPKRESAVEALKVKTQVLDDITNIKGLLVIEKASGLLMFKHIISGIEENNESLFTGFLSAIVMFSRRLSGDNGTLSNGNQPNELPDNRGGDVEEEKEKTITEHDPSGKYIEFTHETFTILVKDGNKIRVALILEERSSPQLRSMVNNFIGEFEGIFDIVLDNWSGNTDIFMETTPALVEQIFKLSYLKDFMINDAANAHILIRKFVQANSVSEQVFHIIETLSEDQKRFRIKTIISLIPEEQRLEAKDVLLTFIKNKILVNAPEDS